MNILLLSSTHFYNILTGFWEEHITLEHCCRDRDKPSTHGSTQVLQLLDLLFPLHYSTVALIFIATKPRVSQTTEFSNYTNTLHLIIVSALQMDCRKGKMLHLLPACLNFECWSLQQNPKSLRAGLLLAF